MSLILWQGNVAIRNGLFAKAGFAVISDDEILIKSKNSENAKVLFKINKSVIKEVSASKGDFNEYMLKGYQGFKVVYLEGQLQKELKFWPKGFGQYHNTKEFPAFVSALGNLSNIDEEALALESKKVGNSFVIAFILIVPSILFFGPLPGFLVCVASFGAFSLWNNEKMPVVLRKVLAVIIVLMAVVIALAINIFAGIALNQQ
jgi:hypothetical protein